MSAGLLSAEHRAGIRLPLERVKAEKILGRWEKVGSVPCRGLPKENLGGVVFGCTNETIEECFSLRLFGSPAAHSSYVQNISVGLPLFLFNFDDRTMQGIFKAASPGGWNFNPYAWKKDGKGRKYPAQVRVAVQEYCQPVPEAEYSSAIQENYLDGTRFMFELTKSQAGSLCKIFRGWVKMPISEPASFGRYSREFVMATEGSPSMLRSPVDTEIPWIEPCEQQQIALSHSLTQADCADKHVSVQETCDKSIFIDEQQSEMPEVADDEHKNEMLEEQVYEVVDAPGDSKIDARSREKTSSAAATDKSSIISTSSLVSQGGRESERGPTNVVDALSDEHKNEVPEEQVDVPGELKMTDARSREKTSTAAVTYKSSIISTSSLVSQGGGESEGGPDANAAGPKKVEFHSILQKLRRFEAQQSERALERQKALESTQVEDCHPELESLAQIRMQNQRVSTLRDVDSMLAKAVTKSVSICAEAFTEMQQGMCELKSIIEDLNIKCLQADMLRTKKVALLDSATDTSSQLSSLKLDVLELKLKLLSLSYC